MFLFFFHFLRSDVPDSKGHKQKWCVLFLTCTILVAHVLACAWQSNEEDWEHASSKNKKWKYSKKNYLLTVNQTKLNCTTDFVLNWFLNTASMLFETDFWKMKIEEKLHIIQTFFYFLKIFIIIYFPSFALALLFH